MPSIKCDCRSRVPVTQLLSESGEPKPTTPLADVEGKLAAETDGQTSLLPASEMIDRELVTLALESHARALMYPNSRVQHDRANECHDELLRRLNTRASDAGKEAERSEEDAIIERDHLSDLIQHLDEAAGFDGEYKAVIGSHVVDEDFMCERITTVLKNASKEYVRGQIQGLEDAAKIAESFYDDQQRRGIEYGDAPGERDWLEIDTDIATVIRAFIRTLISQHLPEVKIK